MKSSYELAMERLQKETPPPLPTQPPPSPVEHATNGRIWFTEAPRFKNRAAFFQDIARRTGCTIRTETVPYNPGRTIFTVSLLTLPKYFDREMIRVQFHGTASTMDAFENVVRQEMMIASSQELMSRFMMSPVPFYIVGVHTQRPRYTRWPSFAPAIMKLSPFAQHAKFYPVTGLQNTSDGVQTPLYRVWLPGTKALDLGADEIIAKCKTGEITSKALVIKWGIGFKRRHPIQEFPEFAPYLLAADTT